jgi:hypothetical protein
MVMTTVLMPPARSVGRRAVRSIPPARRPRVALSSMVYFPAFSIPVVAAVLVGIGWSSGWGGAAFAGSLTSLRLAVATTAFLRPRLPP